MSKEKVCIFIDGGNIFHAANSLNIRVDFAKLIRELIGSRHLVQAFYYGATPNTPDQNRFFSKLHHLGIEVKTLPLRQYNATPFEKGIDVMLVTDMLLYAHQSRYDTALLVSGDKDFTYAIKAIQAIGKTVEVAAFSHAFATELQTTANTTTILDPLIPRIKRH
jgi:uncharacterized LabA/DUF88 family protein